MVRFKGKRIFRVRTVFRYSIWTPQIVPFESLYEEHIHTRHFWVLVGTSFNTYKFFLKIGAPFIILCRVGKGLSIGSMRIRFVQFNSAWLWYLRAMPCHAMHQYFTLRTAFGYHSAEKYVQYVSQQTVHIEFWFDANMYRINGTLRWNTVNRDRSVNQTVSHLWKKKRS